jgi:hypothetical protein
MPGAKSISHCQGKGSLSHNNRDFKTKNVDSSRTDDNITFIKQTIAEAYEECFGTAVQRYNERQSRADRQIKTSYYESVFNHVPCNKVITSPDKRKSFYEDVVQIGTMNDTGCGTADGKLASECLTEYIQGFSKRNPNMHVFNAVLHQDEATPHLHIDYIPIGHYSRGIDTQNGIAQALKEMGYGNGKDAISRWRESERKVLEDICKLRGIEISEPKESRGSLSVEEYKEYSKLHKEKEALERNVQALQATLEPLRDLNTISEQNAVQATPVALSGKFGGEKKFTVTETELSELTKQKRATAVIAAEQQQIAVNLTRISTELSKRENLITGRETKINDIENDYQNRLDILSNKLTEAQSELNNQSIDYQIEINNINKEFNLEKKQNKELLAKNNDLEKRLSCLETSSKKNDNENLFLEAQVTADIERIKELEEHIKNLEPKAELAGKIDELINFSSEFNQAVINTTNLYESYQKEKKREEERIQKEQALKKLGTREQLEKWQDNAEKIIEEEKQKNIQRRFTEREL